jgi:hypothetical protein
MMLRTGCCLAALVFLSSSALPQTMTLAEARARIPDRPIPEFWCGDVSGLEARWAKLRLGHVSTVAVTPGRRLVRLISYGEPEALPRHANFNSAVGAHEPSAYLDKKARHRPVVLFVGPVHGQEVEGLTGLVNLVQVMETGSDLRGTPQPRLRSLGQQCRLLIIPTGNPDGVARFEPRMLIGMDELDLRFWGQGSWSDGTVCDWPQVKRLHPMRGEKVGFLGCYFNDAGVNPMHDEFFAPMSSEAPAILQLAMQEGPDLATSLHSHESDPAILRPAYVPVEIQREARALAERLSRRLADSGLPHGSLFTPQIEGGVSPDPFNLASALYHVSGAVAFTFECPHGLRADRACHVTPTQILDLQLALYESMLEYALDSRAK